MMRPLNFCYYLQGLSETLIEERPTVEQWSCVLRMFSQVEGSGIGADDPYLHTIMPGTFVTWLRGYIEISDVGAPNEREWKIIKEHLQLVFVKVYQQQGDIKVDSRKEILNEDDVINREEVEIPPILSKEEIDKILKEREMPNKLDYVWCRWGDPRDCCTGIAFGGISPPHNEDLPGS